jgi:hypothetical protein
MSGLRDDPDIQFQSENCKDKTAFISNEPDAILRTVERHASEAYRRAG